MNKLSEPKNNPDVQMLEAARVLARQGQTKKAIAFYQEACRLRTQCPDTHRELSILLLNQAVSAWIPWEKERLTREAGLTAGRAIQLGDLNGDCWFIVAETGGMLGKSATNIPSVLLRAFTLYSEQIERGEQVNAFYLGTALRLAEINESMGHYPAAIEFYTIMARAAELERSGQVKTGSSSPDQIENARVAIASIQARMGQQGGGA